MRGYNKELETKLAGANATASSAGTEERQKQERKQRSANGECASKMMSFRIDGENVEFLAKVSNKGRLINNLLAKYREQLPITKAV